MATTTNLNSIILKYRRRVNDMTKKDGTFYSLTDLTGSGSLYSGMGEDVGGVAEANAGAQTNQEIADLATDCTNMWLDSLASTFRDSRKSSFPTYAEMTKYVPEYVAYLDDPTVSLSQVHGQLHIGGGLRQSVTGLIEILPNAYYGYPVSALLISEHFVDDKELVLYFSEPQ